jgi:hypothetical protein
MHANSENFLFLFKPFYKSVIVLLREGINVLDLKKINSVQFQVKHNLKEFY